MSSKSGIAHILGEGYENPLDLIHEAREGMPKSAFNQLQQHMGIWE